MYTLFYPHPQPLSTFSKIKSLDKLKNLTNRDLTKKFQHEINIIIVLSTQHGFFVTGALTIDPVTLVLNASFKYRIWVDEIQRLKSLKTNASKMLLEHLLLEQMF
jgi:hypothetical protein